MFLVVPTNLGDNMDTSPRLARILKIGEIVNHLVGVGKAFAAKFFPGAGSDPVEFEALSDLLGKATTEYDSHCDPLRVEEPKWRWP